MNANLIIGSRGFIGSNLMAFMPGAKGVTKATISSVYEAEFESVFCAAPHARKWWANQNPVLDHEQIISLIQSCQRIAVNKSFTLISTVDVYEPPVVADERQQANCISQAYGRNRALLERELLRIYGDKLHILRLPGLVGKGLKKNIIYDLISGNDVSAIKLDSCFQWFSLECLQDVLSLSPSIPGRVLNVAPEPIPTSLIVDTWFPSLKRSLDSHSCGVHYDMKTLYGPNLGPYLYTRDQILEKHLAPYIEPRLGPL